MKARILNIALAFAVVLSLSCCGVGDEILIDEIPTETTSETAETPEELTADETTYETTTEKMTETTSEETEEVTPEATALTIPDEETILASLSDEEKEVWLSMPDIVTMRVLMLYDKWEKEQYSEFLYNEIIYIDKIGQVKKIISYEEIITNDEDEYIEWLNGQISQNKDVEIINVADIHTLIEFYKTFKLINSDCVSSSIYGGIRADDIDPTHHYFKIYGIRNDGDVGFETLEISIGSTYNFRIQRNKNDVSNTSGIDTLDLYLQLDPFMVYTRHWANLTDNYQ